MEMDRQILVEGAELFLADQSLQAPLLVELESVKQQREHLVKLVVGSKVDLMQEIAVQNITGHDHLQKAAELRMEHMVYETSEGRNHNYGVAKMNFD